MTRPKTTDTGEVSGIQLIMSATDKQLIALARAAGIEGWAPTVSRSDEVVGHFYIKVVSARRARVLRLRGVLTVPAGRTCTGRVQYAYRRFTSLRKSESPTIP